MEDARDEAESDRLADVVEKAAKDLGEHFECVQVFASRHEGGDVGTQYIDSGVGNHLAREGQVSEWLAVVREKAIRRCLRDEDRS
jgi:hypothetical protein